MTVNILLFGSTGSGKSSVCNLISKCLGAGNPVPLLLEGAGSQSCTQYPTAVVNGNYKLIDNPGMLDTGGSKTDEENIKKIVTFARDQLGYLNVVIIVLNHQCARLDDGILNGIKLCVDSFGQEILSRMGFIYTHAFNVKKDILTNRVAENSALINGRCKSQCVFPFWYVDCHPEELAEIMVPDTITALGKASFETVGNILHWAGGYGPFSTMYAVFGEYEKARLLREAVLLAQQQREEADRQRILARQQQEEADRQRILAQQQREEADRQRTIVQQQLKEAERVRIEILNQQTIMQDQINNLTVKSTDVIRRTREIERREINKTDYAFGIRCGQHFVRYDCVMVNEAQDVTEYKSGRIAYGNWRQEGNTWIKGCGK